jgi:hypothetical protein
MFEWPIWMWVPNEMLTGIHDLMYLQQVDSYLTAPCSDSRSIDRMYSECPQAVLSRVLCPKGLPKAFPKQSAILIHTTWHGWPEGLNITYTLCAITEAIISLGINGCPWTLYTTMGPTPVIHRVVCDDGTYSCPALSSVWLWDLLLCGTE